MAPGDAPAGRLAASLVLCGALALAAASCGSGAKAHPPALPTLPTLGTPLAAAPSIQGAPPVQGPLRAPGGPFLRDGLGRVIVLHGVNAVDKRPPQELYPDPGQPWNLSAADASLMARLGFDVVRLGITWDGVEPGVAAPNDPSICSKGPAGDPGQFDPARAQRYLARLARTVDLLGRYHIFTILDMHQDIYSSVFGGEGAPPWAVCTNGIRFVRSPGRWSRNYGNPAVDAAFSNFWTNDVRGNLQGEFDRAWVTVAAAFRSNPWVLGYDLYNEPFSTGLALRGGRLLDAQLTCFYEGRVRAEHPVVGPALPCAPGVPAQGLIPQIQAVDPGHLIFVEPDIFSLRTTNVVAPMDLPGLVFNIHLYCSHRSGHTGNPSPFEEDACADQESRALAVRAEQRPALATPAQPGGPASVVSELGATSDPSLLTALMGDQDQFLSSWVYWSWRYYGDPTGSSEEALLTAGGTLRPTARVLSRTYPEAVAGNPTLISFNPMTAAFELRYLPDHAIAAPTVIVVPTRIHYQDGYCARVRGATVVSSRDSPLLEVRNASGSRLVTVAVTPGAC